MLKLDKNIIVEFTVDKYIEFSDNYEALCVLTSYSIERSIREVLIQKAYEELKERFYYYKFRFVIDKHRGVSDGSVQLRGKLIGEISL